MASVIAAVTTQNIMSEWHEGHETWEAVILEYSSALAFLPGLLIPWWASGLGRPRWGWPGLLLAHALASLVFSAAHVGLFTLLRHGAYALTDRPYPFTLSPDAFLYEYRKDLLAYAGAATLFWLIPKLLARPQVPAALEPAPAAQPPPLFEVRDGPRLLRAPPSDIVAVCSAGNYVEVKLADGRRPLTRMTLAQAEAALSPHGFLRVHRSWIVNAARVRAVNPQGSGDYALDLGDGLDVPLSRRFPDALARLRGR